MTALPAPDQPDAGTVAWHARLRWLDARLARIREDCRQRRAAVETSAQPIPDSARPPQDAPTGPVAPLGRDPRQCRAAD